MTQFKKGDKVRVNEGLLENQTGIITWEGDGHVTAVKIEDEAFGGGHLIFYTETLVSGDEPHPALAKMKDLYPDFLKSDRYFYRLNTNVGGLEYMSLYMNAARLQEVLQYPPAGLVRLEFMLKNDDPSRGLAWKVLWSDPSS